MTFSIVRPMTAHRRCTHLLRTRSRIEQCKRSQEKRESKSKRKANDITVVNAKQSLVSPTTTQQQQHRTGLLFCFSWPPQTSEITLYKGLLQPIYSFSPLFSSRHSSSLWDSTLSLVSDIQVHIQTDNGLRTQVRRSRKPYSSGAHVA